MMPRVKPLLAASGAGRSPALSWRIGAGVLWLALVCLAYYAVHKPVTAADLAALAAPPQGASWALVRTLARLAGAAADGAVALWVMLLAGAVGGALWRLLRWPGPESAEARLTGTVLGLGVLGLTTFALLARGWLTRPVAFALLLTLSLVAAREGVALARWWARAARRVWRAGWRAGAIERVALVFSAATLALLLLTALLPPTAWDALSYHLVSARADATAGRIVLDPGNPQIYQPQLVEMLYTLTLLVRGGDGGATPLHLACGLLAVALVAAWARRAGGERAAVRAAALALALPVVATLAGWPYVDLALAAAELAALVALARWHAAALAGDRAVARGWLLAAGAAAGVALDVKYTGAYAAVALVALIAFAAWRMAGARAEGAARAWPARASATARPALAFLAVALPLGAVWPLRNLVVVGDPVFPYHLGNLFAQGPRWDAARTAFMQGHGWGAMALWRAPLLPLETVLLGQLGSAEFDATLGPALLMLLPLALLLWRAPRGKDDSLGVALYWPVGFAVALWLIWAEELARSGVAMQSRLFLALFLALAGPAALVWLRLEALRLPALSLGRLANAAVLLALALTLVGQATQTLQLSNLAELAGAQPRAAYEAQQLGPYAAAMRELDALGPSARVLLLWEPRSYLTRAWVEPDEYLDAFNVRYRRCGVAAITQCLRQEGFTHVLLYAQGQAFLRQTHTAKDGPAELAVLDALRQTWQPVYQDATPLIGAPGTGWYVLYSLRATP
jgi:hypothetical protein